MVQNFWKRLWEGICAIVKDVKKDVDNTKTACKNFLQNKSMLVIVADAKFTVGNSASNAQEYVNNIQEIHETCRSVNMMLTATLEQAAYIQEVKGFTKIAFVKTVAPVSLDVAVQFFASKIQGQRGLPTINGQPMSTFGVLLDSEKSKIPFIPGILEQIVEMIQLQVDPRDIASAIKDTSSDMF
eukprot:UN23568